MRPESEPARSNGYAKSFPMCLELELRLSHYTAFGSDSLQVQLFERTAHRQNVQHVQIGCPERLRDFPLVRDADGDQDAIFVSRGGSAEFLNPLLQLRRCPSGEQFDAVGHSKQLLHSPALDHAAPADDDDAIAD